MTENLLQGLSPDGWIYEGFQYPKNFTENTEKFISCIYSHPSRIFCCDISAAPAKILSKCTFFNPDIAIPGHSLKCRHNIRTGQLALCKMHLNIPAYIREYTPTTWNATQKDALEKYENGHFSYATNEEQLQEAGDGLILFIVRELADLDSHYDDDEAYRRIKKAASQLSDLADNMLTIPF